MKRLENFINEDYSSSIAGIAVILMIASVMFYVGLVKIKEHRQNDLLGFANYCLELHITEPRKEHIERYRKQGGWTYYQKHIEKAERDE